MRHPPRSLVRRFRWASIAAVLAAIGSATAMAAPASAASTVACTGTQQTTFTPGLTDTLQTVEVSAKTNYTSCVNPEDLFEDRTGSATTKHTSEESCGDLLSLDESVRTITWHIGGTETNSVWDATIIASEPLAGVVLVELAGTITSGEFEGQTATGTYTVPRDSSEECSEPGGLTSDSGVVTLEILPL